MWGDMVKINMFSSKLNTIKNHRLLVGKGCFFLFLQKKYFFYTFKYIIF